MGAFCLSGTLGERSAIQNVFDNLPAQIFFDGSGLEGLVLSTSDVNTSSVLLHDLLADTNEKGRKAQ